jgi:hypothetical protein
MNKKICSFLGLFKIIKKNEQVKTLFPSAFVSNIQNVHFFSQFIRNEGKQKVYFKKGNGILKEKQ